MDEEDLADAADDQKLKTSEAFSGLGSTQDDGVRRSAIMDLFRASGDTKGHQLLRRMGWRDGHGIGPKIRRQGIDDDEGALGKQGEKHLFAPADSPVISLRRKDDTKGLGYQGEAGLLEQSSDQLHIANGDGSDTDRKSMAVSLLPKAKGKQRGGFGVGVLNDTGSEDEDPYAIGPKISYNKTIGAEKKSKKKDQAKSAIVKPNPLLKAAPVFKQRKGMKLNSDLRKCHDGRLPLDGFVLATAEPVAQDSKHAPPTVPATWRPSKSKPEAMSGNSAYQSTADVAKASNLQPDSRAKMLGEAVLPGKSVYDFLKPGARNRIAALTQNNALPEAGSESVPLEEMQGVPVIPELDPQVAKTALGRGVSGFVPYSENPLKLARYRAFLSYRAGLTTEPPSLPSGMRQDDWTKELLEFAHAATIFKPMTGLMASRFTSGKATAAVESGPEPEEGTEVLLKPQAKRSDPAEEAAQMGMFGPLTRTSVQFYPSRLLCKRFNVPVPSHVTAENEGTAATAPALKSSGDEPHPMPSGNSVSDTGPRFQSGGIQAASSKDNELLSNRAMLTLTKDAGIELKQAPEGVPIEADKNEALEAERPGDAVFKAIFGDDSDED